MNFRRFKPFNQLLTFEASVLLSRAVVHSSIHSSHTYLITSNRIKANLDVCCTLVVNGKRHEMQEQPIASKRNSNCSRNAAAKLQNTSRRRHCLCATEAVVFASSSSITHSSARALICPSSH